MLRESGELDVAVTDHQAADLRDVARMAHEYGEELEYLDAGATRALVDSPSYRAGLLDRTGVALVDPARLAWPHCPPSRGSRAHRQLFR